jgi:hypothetical protein
VRFEPVQCFNHRTIGAVVGAEPQGGENQREVPVVVILLANSNCLIAIKFFPELGKG